MPTACSTANHGHDAARAEPRTGGLVSRAVGLSRAVATVSSVPRPAFGG